MVRMIMPVLISRDRFISLALSQLAPLLPSLLYTPGAADPEAVKLRLHGGAQLGPGLAAQLRRGQPCVVDLLVPRGTRVRLSAGVTQRLANQREELVPALRQVRGRAQQVHP